MDPDRKSRKQNNAVSAELPKGGQSSLPSAFRGGFVGSACVAGCEIAATLLKWMGQSIVCATSAIEANAETRGAW